VLGWMGPRGVAPERMPKADATELAPKNWRNPWEAVTGVFFWMNSLVKLLSGGLGLQNAKSAGLLLPGAPFAFHSV